MKSFSALVLTVLFLADAGCSSKTEPASAESPPASVAPVADRSADGGLEFLPTGTFNVDLMEVSMPPRGAKLAERFLAAVRKDPEWFQAQVAASEPGVPLPYDSRFGLTREEYDEFLVLSKQMSARRTGGAKLVVTPGKSGAYVLDGGSALPELTGITIDPGQDEVRTPLGVASERSAIDAGADSPLGAWKGVQWKLESVDMEKGTGTIIKFAIGRLAASGRGVLYYDVKGVSADGNTRITRVLHYELPPKG